MVLLAWMVLLGIPSNRHANRPRAQFGSNFGTAAIGTNAVRRVRSAV